MNYFANPKARRQIDSGLRVFGKKLRKRGICGVVLLHTQLTALGPLHPFVDHYEAVAHSARTAGFTVAESFPYYKGRDAMSLWILPWDQHPNTEGHRILADALEAGLARLPANCFKRARRKLHTRRSQARREEAPIP